MSYVVTRELLVLTNFSPVQNQQVELWIVNLVWLSYTLTCFLLHFIVLRKHCGNQNCVEK